MTILAACSCWARVRTLQVTRCWHRRRPLLCRVLTALSARPRSLPGVGSQASTDLPATALCRCWGLWRCGRAPPSPAAPPLGPWAPAAKPRLETRARVRFLLARAEARALPGRRRAPSPRSAPAGRALIGSQPRPAPRRPAPPPPDPWLPALGRRSGPSRSMPGVFGFLSDFGPWARGLFWVPDVGVSLTSILNPVPARDRGTLRTLAGIAPRGPAKAGLESLCGLQRA